MSGGSLLSRLRAEHFIRGQHKEDFASAPGHHDDNDDNDPNGFLRPWTSHVRIVIQAAVQSFGQQVRIRREVENGPESND